jgi:DNA-binding MarR family transcriptional regulator
MRKHRHPVTGSSGRDQAPKRPGRCGPRFPPQSKTAGGSATAGKRPTGSAPPIVQQLDRALPEALPILNAVWAGWFAELPNPPRLQRQPIAAAVPGLHALLSKTLFALTLDFERQSDLSLAIGSNLIRVLNDTGVRHADLPRLTGVSKEAIKMMLGFLCKYRFVVVENDPAAPRAKQVRLTAKGIESRHTFEQRLKAAETRWQKTYGAETLQNLRQSLETLTIAPAGQPSPLLASVQSYPEGWRARRPQPETLPHHPLILHRGAFPDGA